MHEAMSHVGDKAKFACQGWHVQRFHTCECNRDGCSVLVCRIKGAAHGHKSHAGVLAKRTPQLVNGAHIAVQKPHHSQAVWNKFLA